MHHCDFNYVNFVYYFETSEGFSFELEKIDVTLSDLAIHVQHNIFVRCDIQQYSTGWIFVKCRMQHIFEKVIIQHVGERLQQIYVALLVSDLWSLISLSPLYFYWKEGEGITTHS